MELSVVPVFQSEIVPKQVRGLVVETYQLMLFVSDPGLFVFRLLADTLFSL